MQADGTRVGQAGEVIGAGGTLGLVRTGRRFRRRHRASNWPPEACEMFLMKAFFHDGRARGHLRRHRDREEER